MAEMKNKAPLMEHHGRPVEEKVLLPASYIISLAFREKDSRHVRERLGELMKSCKAEMLSERIALGMSGDALRVVAALPSAPVGPLDYKITPPTKLIRDLVNGRVPAVMNCRMNVIDVRALAVSNDGLKLYALD